MRIIEPTAEHLLPVLDYLGTLLFAIEGAMVAIRAELDLLGMVVLAFATALGGGIVRDLLIGATPPAALKDWRLATVAFVGAGVAFSFYGFVRQIPEFPLMMLDAAGLALFAISGSAKALEYGIHPFVAVLMGTITGVGGGVVRDMMLAHIPNVLRADIYAVAAMAGAAVLTAGFKLGFSQTLMAWIGGGTCFALRVISVWKHWNLPHIQMP